MWNSKDHGAATRRVERPFSLQWAKIWFVFCVNSARGSDRMCYCWRGGWLPKIGTADHRGELKGLLCIDRGTSRNSPVVNGAVDSSSLQTLPGSGSEALDQHRWHNNGHHGQRPQAPSPLCFRCCSDPHLHADEKGLSFFFQGLRGIPVLWTFPGLCVLSAIAFKWLLFENPSYLLT